MLVWKLRDHSHNHVCWLVKYLLPDRVKSATSWSNTLIVVKPGLSWQVEFDASMREVRSASYSSGRMKAVTDRGHFTVSMACSVWILPVISTSNCTWISMFSQIDQLDRIEYNIFSSLGEQFYIISVHLNIIIICCSTTVGRIPEKLCLSSSRI